MSANNKEFEDLLIEFDEMGYEPTTLCENQQKEIETFRNRLNQALTELEQIKEAKPSEAMDRLEGLGFGLWNEDKSIVSINGHYFKNAYDTIKQALLKAQEQEKTLNIIKKKDVDIYILKSCKTVDEYNSSIVHIVGETRELTQEEFDELKRWSENEN